MARFHTFGFVLGVLLSSSAVGQDFSPPAAAIGWEPWFRSSQPLAVSSAPHPAVARITVPERDGIAFGSGTLVDVQGDQGLVITNWHVVRDAAGDIEVAFPDGHRSKAKVIKTDRDWDLAALAIWKPQVAPVSLSPTAPQPGETLTIAGYGSGNFRAATAKCTQYVSPGRSLPFEMVEVGTEARQGDSGGPILNERGEIAGVLFRAGGGTTSGSYVGRVRTFLATVSPRLSDPSAMSPPENIAGSSNPFVNPHGIPKLIAEANARAPAVDKPISGDGWRAAALAKADAATTSVADDQMQAIPSSAPRVEVPQVARFASSTKSQITFGSLPEQQTPADCSLANESKTAAASAEQEAPAKLWSRPLPMLPEPAVATAETADPSQASAAAASPPVQGEFVRTLLGTTLVDQGKSLFAIIGVLALAVRFFRS